MPPSGITWKYHFIDKCSSTNTELRQRLMDGISHAGDVLITEEQTAGRGRLGRSWLSPSGNLAFSFVIDVPKMFQNLTYQVNLVIGLALTRAVQEQFRLIRFDLRRPSQKWPNDVLIDGKKIAGILSEAVLERDCAIIGVGVNLNSSVYDFPQDLQPYLTTVRDVCCRQISQEPFLTLFFSQASRYLDAYFDKGLVGLLPEIHEVLAFRGEWTRINEDGLVYEAQLREVLPDGRLRVLLGSGETRDLMTGDVNFQYQIS